LRIFRSSRNVASELNRPDKSAGDIIVGLRKPLYAVTVALSASLLFIVEPAAAKALLPKFGGAAGVWIACILFFQVTLLAGYLYVYALTRFLSARAQAAIHIALLAASAWALSWTPPGAGATSADHPLLAILAALAASIGLPFLALSATSPLLQAWYGQGAPYRLFALSNAASLGALLAYPILIEPRFALSAQFRGWAALYLAFAVSCLVCALANRAPRIAKPARASIRAAASWAALAACAAVLWPAVANHLSQEVAAIPFLWVLPLSVYLLSFILCFEGRGWYRPQLFRWLLPVACAAIAWRLGLQGSAGGIEWEIPVFCAALFVCCMFCHGELARLKPDPADGLAFFYFMVALGGASGAAFVSLFAPNVFHTFLELPVGVAACFILSLPLLYRRGAPRQLLRVSLVAAAAFAFVNTYGAGMQSTFRIRNFYGALQVTEGGAGDDAIRSLYNGKVLHGAQYLAPAKSRIATAYYAPETGVGLVMRWLRGDDRWRVAVVGLGTGTLAVYGRPGDSYRFFDINPAVIGIAWGDFRYLRESAAKIETVAIDGRLGLTREPQRSLNLIALDAFSGDSIPVHLLTREAFAMYFDRLSAGGVIAIHITNRYLDIASVVHAVAASLGKPVLVIHNAGDADRAVQATDWAILANRREDLSAIEPFAAGRPARRIAAWTDDYSNLFEIFK
jgi:hypothetical protein